MSLINSAVRAGVLKIMREVLIIGAASVIVLACLQLIQPRLRRQAVTPETARMQCISQLPLLLPGKQISVSSVSAQAQPLTVYLFTSAQCIHCKTSATFHKQIIIEASNRGVPVVVALAPLDNAPEHLIVPGSVRPKFIRWSELSHRVAGTPSIVLVDAQGKVRRVWVGKLSKYFEQEVLTAIADPAHLQSATRRLTSGESVLGLQDLRKLSLAGRVTVVSIAERSIYTNNHDLLSVNIPYEELATRASFELDSSHLIVIDCTSEIDPKCEKAVEKLREYGFRVGVVDSTLGER